jgi:hypothetical protein
MDISDFILILLATALAAVIILPAVDFALAKVGVKTA